jgi:hypothetical protein
VIATILIIRTVWPERVNKPFLKRKHYLVIVPIIVLIYVIAISLAASTYVPQPSAIIILILLCVGLLYLAKTGEKVIPKKLRGISAKSYIKYGILLIVLSVLIPLSIAKISPFEIPLTILFVILCYAFWIFFKRMDSDNNLTNKKLFYIFSLFILFWLFLGIIFRTPISTAAAFIGVGIEIYLGWSSLKNDDYTPKHN